MLLVDKPSGPTSHDVVDMVRRRLRTRRVGHAGTLDPFATGLLLVLVGRATRLAQYLVGLPKRYEGTIRLGVATDSFDLTGETVSESDAWQDLSDDAIAREAQRLVGRQRQRPPVYSAKKIEGQPAHRRKRRGEEVEVPEHEVDVFSFTMGARSGPDVTFETHVGSGTYVRSLASDLGRALGCGAHLRALRRVSIGDFAVGDALPPDGVTEASLQPAAAAVAHLPTLEVEAGQRVDVCHGRAIPTDLTSGLCAVVADGQLVAVGEATDGALQPRVVVGGS